MASQNPVEQKLNLLENGIDFILKGISELFDDDNQLHISPEDVHTPNEMGLFPNNFFIEESLEQTTRTSSDPTDRKISAYKYGVLHLFAGFLLLIKEKLKRHAVELIYVGRPEEVRNKLANGKLPNTVDFDTALDKLELGPRFRFVDHELKTIRRMQNYRNTFEHYSININPYEVWSNVSKFLAIIDNFLVQQLDTKLETEHPEIYFKLANVQNMWRVERKKRIEDWKKKRTRILSDFLNEKTNIIQQLDDENFASHGSERIYDNCPECYEDSLIILGEYSGVCANCDQYFYLAECNRCEVLEPKLNYAGYDEITLCESCNQFIDEQ